MSKKPVLINAETKVSILKRHYLEQEPVSKLCEEHNTSPRNFYDWQKKLFEHAAEIFKGSTKKSSDDKSSRRIRELEQKLQQKDEVLAELMADYVAFKKSTMGRTQQAMD